MGKQKSKNWLYIIGAVIVSVGVGVGVYFGGKSIYNSGIDNGVQSTENKMKDALNTLGQAVQEKTDLQEKITGIFKDLPETTNSEAIDKYIENLNNLINETQNEDIKNTLNDFNNKWQEFKNTYASQDNNQISEAFNALKTYAADTADKIKTFYDEAIRAAVNNL